jgi:hypothetical protein
MEIAIKFDVPGTTEEYYLTPLSPEDAEAMREIVTTESINKFLAKFPKSYVLSRFAHPPPRFHSHFVAYQIQMLIQREQMFLRRYKNPNL